MPQTQTVLSVRNRKRRRVLVRLCGMDGGNSVSVLPYEWPPSPSGAFRGLQMRYPSASPYISAQVAPFRRTSSPGSGFPPPLKPLPPSGLEHRNPHPIHCPTTPFFPQVPPPHGLTLIVPHYHRPGHRP
ncbi:hypothetical protein Vafri_19372 [Volvox africanus]|uniref:Uncharacterized protein n=1 Tax=Volvox africanus TaxID=51714 RepID=A0A8J4FCU0_9CHLO|nr:hypothetical protein Vafri_19372 [Volvox africanus]